MTTLTSQQEKQLAAIYETYLTGKEKHIHSRMASDGIQDLIFSGLGCFSCKKRLEKINFNKMDENSKWDYFWAMIHCSTCKDKTEKVITRFFAPKSYAKYTYANEYDDAVNKTLGLMEQSIELLRKDSSSGPVFVDQRKRRSRSRKRRRRL
tara:strand:+ start:940 stop:1392 length:453 start_codon:yes stop_codon:yes gene_type:complete